MPVGHREFARRQAQSKRAVGSWGNSRTPSYKTIGYGGNAGSQQLQDQQVPDESFGD